MTDEEITALVFAREEPICADLAIVFGAANEDELVERVQHAVGLYRDGYAPKLLLTGGGVLAQSRPEAKRMSQVARELGVRDSDLLIEDRSCNTFENVQYSKSVLQAGELFARLSTVLLVTSEWHMRRVSLTTRKYFGESIRLVCCPTLKGCNRDNWTESKSYRRFVSDEALLLLTLLEVGGLPSPQ